MSRQYNGYDNYYGRNGNYPSAPSKAIKRRNAKLIVKNIAVSVAAIILIIINVVSTLVWSVLGKINYIPDSSGDDYSYYDDQYDINNEPVVSGTSVAASSTTDVSQPPTITESDPLIALAESYGAVKNENGLLSKEGVKNYLVLGSDSRYRLKKKWNCNTDAIIIATVDTINKKIILTSVMRDIYVFIPGRNKYDKINSACAYNGGPTRTVKVVEDNFGIDIDNFVIVSFYSFIDIVSALGGVTVDINKEEQKWLNKYVGEFNVKAGYDIDHGKLQHTGKDILLSGKQAMGYVRIRYEGNGDYERTERQREVLEQLIQKARKANYAKLIKLIDKVANYISTDFTSDELILFAAEAINYLDYGIEQFRVPIEGTYNGHFVTDDTWALEIEFEPNKEALYKRIFGNNAA